MPEWVTADIPVLHCMELFQWKAEVEPKRAHFKIREGDRVRSIASSFLPPVSTYPARTFCAPGFFRTGSMRNSSLLCKA